MTQPEFEQPEQPEQPIPAWLPPGAVFDPAALANTPPSDWFLRDEIHMLLMHMDDLDHASLQIDVADGVATIQGQVAHEYVLQQAEQRIALLEGVKAIHNQLQVRPAT